MGGENGIGYAADTRNLRAGVYRHDHRQGDRGSDQRHEDRRANKHWALLYEGKFYDPEFGVIEGAYTHGKITSFLGIYE